MSPALTIPKIPMTPSLNVSVAGVSPLSDVPAAGHPPIFADLLALLGGVVPPAEPVEDGSGFSPQQMASDVEPAEATPQAPETPEAAPPLSLAGAAELPVTAHFAAAVRPPLSLPAPPMPQQQAHPSGADSIAPRALMPKAEPVSGPQATAPLVSPQGKQAPGAFDAGRTTQAAPAADQVKALTLAEPLSLKNGAAKIAKPLEALAVVQAHPITSSSFSLAEQPAAPGQSPSQPLAASLAPTSQSASPEGVDMGLTIDRLTEASRQGRAGGARLQIANDDLGLVGIRLQASPGTALQASLTNPEPQFATIVQATAERGQLDQSGMDRNGAGGSQAHTAGGSAREYGTLLQRDGTAPDLGSGRQHDQRGDRRAIAPERTHQRSPSDGDAVFHGSRTRGLYA